MDGDVDGGADERKERNEMALGWECLGRDREVMDGRDKERPGDDSTHRASARLGRTVPARSASTSLSF